MSFKTNKTYTNQLQYTDTPVLAEQQKLTSVSSERTQDGIYRIYQVWIAIWTDGLRESKASVLPARIDVYDKLKDESHQIEFFLSKFQKEKTKVKYNKRSELARHELNNSQTTSASERQRIYEITRGVSRVCLHITFF